MSDDRSTASTRRCWTRSTAAGLAARRWWPHVVEPGAGRGPGRRRRTSPPPPPSPADQLGGPSWCPAQAGVLAGLPVAALRVRGGRRGPGARSSSTGRRRRHGRRPARCCWRPRGPVRDLLTAERTALNLLTHLSGIATLTRLLGGRGGRHRAPDPRHPQDHAGAARAGEVRGALRRRGQPPDVAVGRRADQGQPRRGGRLGRPRRSRWSGGRRRPGAGDRGRGRHPRAVRRGDRGRRRADPAGQHEPAPSCATASRWPARPRRPAGGLRRAEPGRSPPRSPRPGWTTWRSAR